MAFEHRVQVAWGDCDAAGIVFYPNYFRWFDHSAHRMMESVGLGHRDVRERYGVVGTPIVDAGSRFMAPASYGDELVITSQVTDLGTSRFTVTHTARRGDVLICEGHEKRVWAAWSDEEGRLKAVPIPDEVRERLTR